MRLTPLVRCPLLPTLLLALLPGCQALHRYRPVLVLAQDADTRRPIPGALVRISYPLSEPLLAPRQSVGLTGDDGIARLRAAPCGDDSVLVEVTADGYLPEQRLVPAEAVRAVEPAHLFEAVERRPACFVLDVYAEKPWPTVVLIVPTGYRGLIQAEVRPAEDIPYQPGQRQFPCVVPASGSVQLNVPALLRRFASLDFSARYADGTPLGRSAKGTDVGLWQLKSEGPSYTFLVGTEADYAAHRPAEPVGTGERRAPSGGGRGRGRGGHRGDRQPSGPWPPDHAAVQDDARSP